MINDFMFLILDFLPSYSVKLNAIQFNMPIDLSKALPPAVIGLDWDQHANSLFFHSEICVEACCLQEKGKNYAQHLTTLS